MGKRGARRQRDPGSWPRGLYPAASNELRAFPSRWLLYDVARICASWSCYGSSTRRAMMQSQAACAEP